jgi:hypothetical protein
VWWTFSQFDWIKSGRVLLRRRGVFFVCTKPIRIFSASPHQWNILCKVLGGKVVLKRLIDVRWSAHADAVALLIVATMKSNLL